MESRRTFFGKAIAIVCGLAATRKKFAAEQETSGAANVDVFGVPRVVAVCGARTTYVYDPNKKLDSIAALGQRTTYVYDHATRGFRELKDR